MVALLEWQYLHLTGTCFHIKQISHALISGCIFSQYYSFQLQGHFLIKISPKTQISDQYPTINTSCFQIVIIRITSLHSHLPSVFPFVSKVGQMSRKFHWNPTSSHVPPDIILLLSHVKRCSIGDAFVSARQPPAHPSKWPVKCFSSQTCTG